MNANLPEAEIISDIKPVRNEGYDCLQSVINTVANYWGIKPTMMFSLLWGFSYDRKPCRFGDRVEPGYPQDSWKFVEKYNGIKIRKTIPEKPDDYNALKKTVLETVNVKCQVALNIDTYACPWNKNYRKQRYPHYCIIAGFSQGNIVCVDPFSSDNDFEMLPAESLKRGYSFLEFRRQDACDNIDLLELIDTLCNNIRKSDVFFIDSIINLAEDITGLNCGAETENPDDIGSIPLVMKINGIGNVRKNIAGYFNYLYLLFGCEQLQEISRMFSFSFINWYKAKLYLIMFFTTRRNRELENVSKKLFQIAKIEKDILDMLESFTKSFRFHSETQLKKVSEDHTVN